MPATDDNTPVLGRADASAFGTRNILLSGANTRHHVASFAGPISIKAVRHGEVAWRAGGVRRLVRPDSLLLFPQDAEYSMTIDSEAPSRTLCPVFRHGLVEAALRDFRTSDEAQLDDPDDPSGPIDFAPRWASRHSRLGAALAVLSDALDAGVVETWMFELLAARTAEALVGFHDERERLPAVRGSTRAEIHRRLLRARDAVESDLARGWSMTDMAREACMAPFHFNRRFREAFGETPRLWLAGRRLERALALLGASPISVTEACLSVGYVSLGSFSTAFRRRFGVSPSSAATPASPAFAP
ncbi:AraC family transcriptional regulator [Phenylobacterium sp.]|uniref:helix-turn-helix transcriptional regulator n=1 Tax=Phenylobacterium sp. TaxID=1871053 RepID=UPI002F40D9B4